MRLLVQLRLASHIIGRPEESVARRVVDTDVEEVIENGSTPFRLIPFCAGLGKETLTLTLTLTLSDVI